MLAIVIFGASGDLAKRKTYPALFSLYLNKLVPDEFAIYGYARSALSQEQFHGRLEPFLKKVAAANATSPLQGSTRTTPPPTLINNFLSHCHYMSGEYDRDADFERLRDLMAAKGPSPASRMKETHTFDRVSLFYLALPPSIFVTVATHIRRHLYDAQRENRLIVEKPFGKDLESASALSGALAPLFPEREFYRIDHYLGKEMVKNIMILRFANTFFSSLWNRQYISNVQIVFKETLGVEGRGGYFDEYGIIRDVMQNHILQMLTIIAMGRPASLAAEDVRDEKVKVLRCIKPLGLSDVILGQYGRSADGSHAGYLDDETIPDTSSTPTYAMATVYVRNERWDGVPFVLRCGKGLNEQKAEVRIQFADVPGACIFQPGPEPVRNELVIRVQPNEAVYMKLMVKRPGLDSSPIVSDLDLSYAARYEDLRIPDAYESLLLDALRGDRSNFVRADELEAAWRIFSPLLHEIEQKHVQPTIYPYGSRGPAQADERLAQLGYKRNVTPEYTWPRQRLHTPPTGINLK